MVSKELFLAVHNMRVEKGRLGHVNEKDNDDLPLKVFTKCEKCGKSMTGYLVKKKGLYYYKCRTKGCKVNKSTKAMHLLFTDLLKSFQVEKEEQELIKQNGWLQFEPQKSD